jgi:adenylate cyclase
VSSRSIIELREGIDRAVEVKDVDVLLQCAAELVGGEGGEAEFLRALAMGVASYLQGNYTEALTHYRVALRTSEERDAKSDVARVLYNIGLSYEAVSDHTSTMEYFERALSIREELADLRGVARILASMGTLYGKIGDYAAALELNHRAYSIYEQLADTTGMGYAVSAMGHVCMRLGDHVSSLQHALRSLDLFEGIRDRAGMALATSRIGSLYWNSGDYPLALEFYHRSLALNKEIGSQRDIAMVTTNLGNVLVDTGDWQGAMDNYRRALAMFEELGDRHSVARTLGNIGLIHTQNGEHDDALTHHQRCKTVATEIGDRRGIALANGNILSALLAMGADADARELLIKIDVAHIDDHDVRAGIEMHRALLQERAGDLDAAVATLKSTLADAIDHALRPLAAKVHLQLRSLAQRRNDFAAYIEHNNEFTRITEEINGKETATKLAMQDAQRRIDAERKEHEKHMAVLHSTLPKHIADRVARGETVNDTFDNATVLFLDVVGFTTHTSELDAGVVVQLLQNIFTTFDAICAKHDVMKIKTIGDSYMAVAFGTANTEQRTANQIANSEQRIANVAIAMMSSTFTWPHTGDRVQFRIGLHCGPVVAGVLGTERMQYDVWGDTVNVASRMESTSEPGKIHISEVLNEALTQALSEALSKAHIVPRGEMEIKGKGMMKTYWLESPL